MFAKSSFKSTFFLVSVLTFFSGSSSNANPRLLALLQETEKLAASLSSADPDYFKVQQRLADLNFEQALEVGKDPQFRPEEANKYRQKAIAAYGLVQSQVSPEERAKIDFQIAQLHEAAGNTAKARALWEQVYLQKEFPILRREAALHLAVATEKQGKEKKLVESYYLEAMRLGAGAESFLSYVTYRYAWFLYNYPQVSKAANLLKSLVWDSQGRAREEVVRDWVLMLGRREIDADTAIRELEPVATRLGRPELLQDLADSFFSSGNTIAGTEVLDVFDSRHPDPRNQVRLCEQFVGFRRWDRFRKEITKLNSATPGSLGDDSEKILHRLSVQLDGERKTDKERVEDFRSLVLVYIKLFPDRADLGRMIEGWLAVVSDPKERLEQSLRWLKDASPAVERRLREVCADSAQKLGRYDLAAEQTGILAAKTGERRFAYLEARALYELKKYADALPKFRKLAQLTPGRKADEWAVKSENLLLDILAQEKKYALVLQSVRDWMAATAADASLKKENQDIAEIGRKAEFEEAVSLGSTSEALGMFLQKCENKQFLPQSCENAKILSAKLKQEETLLHILNLTNAPELCDELETAGYFREAANCFAGRLGKRVSSKAVLHLAILYDLAGVSTQKNRLLLESVKTVDDFSKNESAWTEAFRSAGLLSADTLKLPFSTPQKIAIANELEMQARGNKLTREILLAATFFPGEGWSKVVLADLEKQARASAKISLTGRNSKRSFLRREALLKSMGMKAHQYLERGDVSSRVQVAGVLARAYKMMAQDILSSPIPKDVSEENKKQILISLREMAAPFEGQAIQARKLAEAEIEKISDRKNQQKLEAAFLGLDALQVVSMAPKISEQIKIASSDLKPQSFVSRLHKDPEDKVALHALSEIFRKAGAKALASYFSGRLQSVAEVKAK